jgi:hypothetical protein
MRCLISSIKCSARLRQSGI